MNRVFSRDLPIAQAYIDQMADTQQNPRYHAEGSVLEHTLMVVEKFFSMKDQFDLSPQEQEILYWTAVLHDIGKTTTSVFEQGRWKSPGHEMAGIPMARDILLAQTDLSIETRRKILSLIGWHGAPLKWVLQQKPLHHLKYLNTWVDLKLLGIFTLFDMHGRICENQEKILSRIAEFQQVSVPKAIYEMGRHASLHEKVANMSRFQKNAVWKAVSLKNMTLLEKVFESENKGEQIYDPYSVPSKKVTITIGPPNSGKTTYLQAHYPEVFTIQLSDFKITETELSDFHNAERRLVEFKYYLSMYLRQHPQLIIEGRNLDATLRQKITEMVRDANGEIEYLIFENDLASAMEFNERRETPIPAKELAALYQSFQLVHDWQAHATTWVSQQEVAALAIPQ